MSFNFTNTPDRAVYENTLAESIEIFGISIEYLVVEYDETKEKLYAEDSKPHTTARYLMKAQAEYLGSEDFMLTKFGLQSSDQMELVISKSKFEEIVGDGAEPKSGDRVYITYQDRYYTVADAKEESNIFLQRKFSWMLILNPTDLIGAEVTPNIGVPDYEDEEDIFNDNDLIDELDDDIVVEKTDDVNPFGDWE
jgi:hypothetical protein